jgi:protein TonB
MTCTTRRLAVTFGFLALAGSAQAQMQTPSWMRPQQTPTSGCARPAYPTDALRAEATGVVTMRFLIGIDGTVRDAKLAKSSGNASLDQAAINALSKCRFKPAEVDGKPVEQWQEVKYAWSID